MVQHRHRIKSSHLAQPVDDHIKWVNSAESRTLIPSLAARVAFSILKSEVDKTVYLQLFT